MQSKPIGIFDSGFGGLTVMAAVNKILPNENLIYFGDNARVPYGSKSKETVIKFSKQIADFLCSKNIKMLVIACNTASALALPTLKKTLEIPVMGVIEAGAEAGVKFCKGKNIVVLATQAAIESNCYKKAIEKISKKFNVHQIACPLLVPIIEQGWQNTKVAKTIVEIYLSKILKEKMNIGSIILGCTHYPFIKDIIREVVGKSVEIVDPADMVAKQLSQFLENNNLRNNSKRPAKLFFYTSDMPAAFKRYGRQFFFKPPKQVRKHSF